MMHSDISVIIAAGYGDLRREKNLQALIEDIKGQTLLPDEIIIVRNVRPRTRAHNEGARAASGKFIIFFDDDIRLPDDHVVERLIERLRHETVGITGATVLPSPASTPFQKRCYKELLRAATTIPHAVLATKKDLYWKTGGEEEMLRLNDDVLLNHRIMKMGYSAEFIPGVFIYHPEPERLSVLLKKSFRQGIDQAHDYAQRPDLILESSLRQDKNVKISSPVKQVMRNIKIIFSAITEFKWLLLLSRLAAGLGFILGRIGMDNASPERKEKIETLALR